MNKGFSLVELAVSIVIIGLIVAAVTSGSKILKQAELRGIIAKMNDLGASVNTFEDVHGALPGDMNDAQYVFTDCAATPANCNGDGNRTVNYASSTSNEVYKAMIHLSRADMIDDVIVAMPDAHAGNMNGLVHAIDDDNRGFFFSGGKEAPSSIGIGVPGFPLFQANKVVYFGALSPLTQNYTASALRALDAFNIDKKIDDGSSSSGLAMGAYTGKFRAEDDTLTVCTNMGTFNYETASEFRACFIGLAID